MNDKANEVIVPTVGMGATYIGFTDRHPYTVIEVKNNRRIVVQEDVATRVDTNGMSDSQEYTYAPNPQGQKVILTLRKDGAWRAQGGCTSLFAVGYRRKYYDYSF